MSTTLTQTSRWWTDEAILNPHRPSESDLLHFERTHALTLPPAVRRYFATLNGTRLGQYGCDTEWDLSFWHLAQVAPLSEEAPGSSKRGNAFERDAWLVADYSIGAILWAVALGPAAGPPAPSTGSGTARSPSPTTSAAF